MANPSQEFGFDISGIKAYSGYSKDAGQLFACASGGAATAFSELVIARGGIVIGVCYSDDFKRAVFAAARTKEDLQKLRSSKYIYADRKIWNGTEWVSVFTETQRLLEEGQEVLFIGLGCEVGALVKILEKQGTDCSRLYTIDLICHGPTFPQIQQAYVEDLEKRFDSKMRSFSVRYKKRGWEPPYVRAEFENGRVFEEQFYASDFGYAFKKYSRASCYQCQFKGAAHAADLTVGDFWGCEKGMEGYHPMGVSIIFSKTQKGAELIEALRRAGTFDLRETDAAYAIRKNTNYYRRRKKKEALYAKFDADFKEHGLHYACISSADYKSYRRDVWKDEIKRKMPRKLLGLVKKLKGH